MFSLKPLEAKKKRKNKKFGVYDIEGRDWINHVVSAFYTYHEEEMTEQLVFFETLEEFIDFCFSQDNIVDEIFCHFGGIYDFLFILNEVFHSHEKVQIKKMMSRGNSLLSFTIESNDREITFRDSSALLPFGLDSITKAFGVKHKKLKMDRNKIYEDTPEVREYLKYDVIGLYESLIKFRTWGKVAQVGMKTTIASQSVQVFRSYLKEEVPSLSRDQDEFVRRSYFGGRTEIFRPYFDGKGKKKIQYVDVNSLYPTIMKTIEVPFIPIGYDKSFNFKTDTGFIECDVEIPDDLYIPPLPAIIDNKLMFPVGSTRGVWSSLELTYAMKFGVKVKKVYKALKFMKPKFLFKDYITDLYNMRLEAKKNNDSVTDVMCKLLMNSCYGRMGLNRLREELVIDDMTMEGISPAFSFGPEEDPFVFIGKKESYVNNTFSNVAIAAWITSGARIHLHGLLVENESGIHYCDTDSLFTTKKNKTGDSLGELKLEYELDKAIFLLPKTYVLHSEEEIFKAVSESGREYRLKDKYVMKGFDNIKDPETNKFTISDFYNALEGDLRGLKTVTKPKMARMKTAFREGKLLMMTKGSTKQIRSLYDKRKVIKLKNGNWDSVPWIVKDGEIINRS